LPEAEAQQNEKEEGRPSAKGTSAGA